jgi:hypothetical protein
VSACKREGGERKRERREEGGERKRKERGYEMVVDIEYDIE